MKTIDEIKDILSPCNDLPMPVVGRDMTKVHELIRIHHALIKLAEKIDSNHTQS